MITITSDFKEVAKAYDRMLKDVRERAMASTINKVADQAKTKMGREITGEFAVSASYVRERLRIKRATFRGGELTLSADLIGGDGRRRSANIIAFVEKKTTLAQARKRSKQGTLGDLFVKVKRTGGHKPLRGAFIGNKGRTVFERVGKDRLPIRPVQTIDVGSMFNTRRINSAVVALIRQKFQEVWAREAKFYLDRMSRAR